MQSKSGSDLTVSEAVRNEIASYRPVMCTVEDVRAYSASKRIVAVGDVTARVLRENGIPLFLEVVDLKTQRGGDGTFQHIEGSVAVDNPPAMLTADLFSAIMKAMDSKGDLRIEVNGEEDLAVIPIIFYSDLNTVVVYGVPMKGMACIDIDQDTKGYIKNLIERMESE